VHYFRPIASATVVPATSAATEALVVRPRCTFSHNAGFGPVSDEQASSGRGQARLDKERPRDAQARLRPGWSGVAGWCHQLRLARRADQVTRPAPTTNRSTHHAETCDHQRPRGGLGNRFRGVDRPRSAPTGRAVLRVEIITPTAMAETVLVGISDIEEREATQFTADKINEAAGECIRPKVSIEAEDGTNRPTIVGIMIKDHFLRDVVAPGEVICWRRGITALRIPGGSAEMNLNVDRHDGADRGAGSRQIRSSGRGSNRSRLRCRGA